MTFIKVVLRDRCLRWWGEHAVRGGGGHLTRLTSAWINSSAGFSFFCPLWAKPHCDRHRDYNHLAVRPARAPAPNILIMDEIHLYVAIIVLNCFFEGDWGQQHLADIWLDGCETDFVPSRKPWARSALYRPFSLNEAKSKARFGGNEADLVTELDEVPKHSAFLHMCLNPIEGVSSPVLAGKWSSL